MNLRVAFAGEAKGNYARSRSESESEHGESESAEADAKPSDLPLGRLKDG